MIKVTAIAFEDSNRIYYFNRNNIELEEKNIVVVETERGLQLGTVKKVDLEIDKDDITLPLKNVLRVAKKEDISTKEKCKVTEKEALKKAMNIASELNLEMKFVSANYTLDKKQLTFNFIADDRVDFRLFTTAPFLYETYQDKIFYRKYEEIRDFETVYSQDIPLRYSSYHDGKFYVNLSSDESVKEKSFAEIKEFMR